MPRWCVWCVCGACDHERIMRPGDSIGDGAWLFPVKAPQWRMNPKKLNFLCMKISVLIKLYQSEVAV